ncbi:unnamed protein product [Mytilus edulis]|uniref:Uncharacterized protein n=1 Tax=Mytilus edulis TaxID=6550 RepID=A0A8S3VEV0_MYTED|nr:unnamed protein product [Mytilus edulis]
MRHIANCTSDVSSCKKKKRHELELIDGSLFLPTFDAEVVEINHSTALKFKCTLFKRPVDSLLHFLVNRKSIVVMYFSNEKCFTKGTECKTDICDCSYNDYSFTWFYPVNSSIIGSAFGIVIKIATEENNKLMKLTLSGIYGKSGFIVNPSTYEEVDFSIETNLDNTNPNEEYEHLKLQNRILIGSITAVVCIVVVVVIVVFLLKQKSKNEPNESDRLILFKNRHDS